ncbi:MAG TPA: phospholipid carrier-dependent glycosyltransferase [Candidatus Binatia bacterium]|nr:phospholipid carrier-dependent glycosyltransferase [Candidatus Binatia bacterium]
MLVTALVLLGGGFRLWGIWWGAPWRIDLHPDERAHVMSHALAVSLADPDPKFLNYPSFLIYLIAITNGALARLGLVTEPWQSYIAARSIVAAFGAATVAVAYWLANEMTGSFLSAVLAALWTALLPLHVWESHFAVTDVVMTFWTVVALACSVRLLRRTRVRDYMATGAAIGLAIASKYTGALVGLSPLVASLIAPRPVATLLAGLGALGLATIVFAFAATPFSFLHFGQFREAMAFEYQHVHSLHYGFALPAVGWQYHKYVYELFAGFPFSMGFALYASAAVGTVWVLVRLRRELIPVLAFAVSFFAIVGHWPFTPLRYQLPVLVVGAVFAGIWQASWLESASRARRVAGAVAVGATFVYTALFTFQTTDRLRHDTRIEAARWLDQTLKPGERLLLCGYSPYLAVPTDQRILVTAANEVLISKLADRTDFDLAEITSMHYWRHERHRHPAFLPAYQRLREGRTPLHLVKRFDADFLNRDLYRRLDPMFAGYFVSPTLEFYARD